MEEDSRLMEFGLIAERFAEAELHFGRDDVSILITVKYRVHAPGPSLRRELRYHVL